MPGQAVSDQYWIRGCNSLPDLTNLAPGEYAWGDNVSNRSGLVGTRPGFGIVGTMIQDLGEPQGAAIFTPRGEKTQLIVAIGGKILISRYPYLTYEEITVANPITSFSDAVFNFSPEAPQIIFKVAMQSVEEAENGTLSPITSRQLLFIQDGGTTRCGLWDGTQGRHLDPTHTPGKYETPAGSWMEWIGSRLWVGVGNRLFASNLADPTKFTETGYTAEGGFYILPDTITGMRATPDFRNLLVGTATTITAFQASILDRLQWAQTPEFQKLILPGIGVVAGKSFYNQYGLTWWYSSDGLIGLDNALQVYRTSLIHFRDNAMMRSKMNMSHNRMSGICLGGFENFLMVSVPYASRWNTHTWALDQAPMETIEQTGSPAWCGAWRGVQPVEWMTGVVNGEYRCFCLSRDQAPPEEGEEPDLTAYVTNLWEAFLPTRQEVGHNASTNRITCAFETKLLGEGFTEKKFIYLQLDLTELQGTVDIEAYFAGLKGGYKLILSKRIVATTNILTAAITVPITNDTIIATMRPQDRLIRSVSVKGGSFANCIESRYTDERDRGFSVLTRWKGQMSVRSVRVFMDVLVEDMNGTCEKDETTDRVVLMNGSGEVFDTMADDSPGTSPLQNSQYFRAHTPRFMEEAYSSLTSEMLEPETLVPNVMLQAPPANLTMPAPVVLTTWVNPTIPPPPVDPPPPGDPNPPDPDPNLDPYPPGYPANYSFWGPPPPP